MGNRQFHVVAVCHCEEVWWEDGTQAFDMSLRAMHELQLRVSARLSKPVTSTVCACVDHQDDGSVRVDVEHSLDLMHAMIDAGNEIGLHTHVPILDLAKGLQDRRIPEDAKRLAGLGLPRPRTYVAGDFVTNPDLPRYLEKAGIQVDCSVINFYGRMNRFGAVMEYDRRKSLKPYHPKSTDVVEEGDSKIVELPVSGALVEFAQPEFKGLAPVVKRIISRYHSLNEGVDVFQMYWHPFEILRRGGLDWRQLAEMAKSGLPADGEPEVDHQLLDAYEHFLTEFGRNNHVHISTAIHAADEWSAWQETKRTSRG